MTGWKGARASLCSGRRRSAFNGSQLATRNDGALSEIWEKGKLKRQAGVGFSANSKQFQQYLPQRFVTTGR
jgi:hypothetical protein